MKKILLTLLCLSTAAFTATPALAAQELGGRSISQYQSELSSQINKRLSSLNALSASLAANPNLTATQKASLEDQIVQTKTRLSEIKNRLADDTSFPTLSGEAVALDKLGIYRSVITALRLRAVTMIQSNTLTDYSRLVADFNTKAGTLGLTAEQTRQLDTILKNIQLQPT